MNIWPETGVVHKGKVGYINDKEVLYGYILYPTWLKSTHPSTFNLLIWQQSVILTYTIQSTLL